MNLGKGDALFTTSTPDEFSLRPCDVTTEAQIMVAEKIMRKRRNILCELAKWPQVKKDYFWISELFEIFIHDRELANHAKHGEPSGKRDNALQ